MKIGHSVPARLVGVPSEPRASAKEAPPETSTSDGGKAVNLSALSRTLSAMESNVADGSVDTQRVSSIKTAIRNGEFKVNAQAVADGLVKSVQDLLSKNPGQ